jgi:hypothetical protein
MASSFASLQLAAGAVTQAITTAQAQYVGWAGTGGANGPSSSTGGDLGITSDKTNSRFTVKPGTYLATVDIQGSLSGAGEVEFQLRKAGMAISGATGRQAWGASNATGQVGLNYVFTVAESDLTSGVCAIDLGVKGSASLTLTSVNANFTLLKVI